MSETPQNPMDPRQGPYRTDPTQPLGQGTPAGQGMPGGPGWGPAAQPPGQLPPPVPAQPPGAPSAWSQHLRPTPPQYGPPNGGPPRGRAKPWLIGGAVLVVAAIVGVIIATSGGDDKDAASGSPSGAPGGAKLPSQAPAGRTFTHVPDGCQLIKAATIASIAPGTECKPSQFDNTTMAALITKMPSWDTPSGSGGHLLHLRVHLTVSPGAKGMYDMDKSTALNALKEMRTTTDSRSLTGLGEEAYVVHAVDKDTGGLAEATVIVHEGNAAFSVSFGYDTSDSGPRQQQSEDAAVAAARDVLGSLS